MRPDKSDLFFDLHMFELTKLRPCGYAFDKIVTGQYESDLIESPLYTLEASRTNCKKQQLVRLVKKA